jgi:uncharacterized lipoprotein
MFKAKIVEYLKEKGVEVERVEQQGETESIVCHIKEADNDKVASLMPEMEKELGVATMMDDSYGMNVLIVEAMELEEE